MKSLPLLALAASVAASPCPYGEMAERGMLSDAEAKNFYAARDDGKVEMSAELKVKRDAEHHAQAQYYKRQLELDDLPLGGGLLSGVLQPFSGTLQGLDVPTYVLAWRSP